MDAAIGNSEIILRELEAEGIPRAKLQLIYNGIDTARFLDSMPSRQQAREALGIPPSAFVLSSVANLFPYKGHDDLLASLHILRHRLPPDWIVLAVSPAATDIARQG